MEKKKRRRIKKPDPDSSDDDGETFVWLYCVESKVYWLFICLVSSDPRFSAADGNERSFTESNRGSRVRLTCRCRSPVQIYLTLLKFIYVVAFGFPAQQSRSELKTRKRRKVLKSRTFMDDEGCMGMKPR